MSLALALIEGIWDTPQLYVVLLHQDTSTSFPYSSFVHLCDSTSLFPLKYYTNCSNNEILKKIRGNWENNRSVDPFPQEILLEVINDSHKEGETESSSLS